MIVLSIMSSGRVVNAVCIVGRVEYSGGVGWVRKCLASTYSLMVVYIVCTIEYHGTECLSGSMQCLHCLTRRLCVLAGR